MARRIRLAALCFACTSGVLILIVGSVFHFRRSEKHSPPGSIDAAVVREQTPALANELTLACCDLGVTNLSFDVIAPGVDYAKGQLDSPPLVYHVVKADLDAQGLRVGVIKPGASANASKQMLKDMVNDAASGSEAAVVAINGDYYEFGVQGPWGIYLQNNKLYYSPTGKSALMIGADGVPEIQIPTSSIAVQLGDDSEWREVIDFNRPSSAASLPGLHLYGYTREFHDVGSMGAAAVIKAAQPSVGGIVTGVVADVVGGGQTVVIPAGGLVLAYNAADSGRPDMIFRAGDQVRIRTEVSPSAVEAIGGGPRIVKDGRPSLEFEKETFSASHAGYLRGRHPRSAVGISRDRKTVIMLVVVGRRAASPGMTADEVARLMVELGAWDAMMFDGGGSAVMYTRKHMLVNKVTGRSLCNALAIFVAR